MPLIPLFAIASFSCLFYSVTLAFERRYKSSLLVLLLAFVCLGTALLITLSWNRTMLLAEQRAHDGKSTQPSTAALTP